MPIRSAQEAPRGGGRVQGGPAIGICPHGGTTLVCRLRCCEKNKWMTRQDPRPDRQGQGKGIIDCFLDLAIEENLDTEWLHGENNVDDEAVAKILTYPNAIIGLSDGGAHVQFQSGFGFSTRLLSEWVREKKIMSLEQAVRRLTFKSASTFGLYDRGLLRPGMVADIVIFDPDTVKPLPLEVCTTSRPAPSGSRSRPRGSWRRRQRRGPDGRRQAHRQSARPRAAQHLLQGAARVIAVPAGPTLPLRGSLPPPCSRGREGRGPALKEGRIAMPTFRPTPDLEMHYDVDDFTDPWRTPERADAARQCRERARLVRWVPTWRGITASCAGHARLWASTPMPRRLPWTLDIIIDDFCGDGPSRRRRFHLVGAKIGGTIARAFAARRPERVTTLTVVGTPPPLRAGRTSASPN